MIGLNWLTGRGRQENQPGERLSKNETSSRPVADGNAERLSWRSQALHVLDQVIRLDSKRAKPADREMFDSAVASVRDRIRSVMADGSLRFY